MQDRYKDNQALTALDQIKGCDELLDFEQKCWFLPLIMQRGCHRSPRGKIVNQGLAAAPVLYRKFHKGTG